MWPRDTDEAPGAGLGVHRARVALANWSSSLARLLGRALDVLIRLWLAAGFLATDAAQHMPPAGHVVGESRLSPSASPRAGAAATGFGVFVQTVCPVLLAIGLFTALPLSRCGCRCSLADV